MNYPLEKREKFPKDKMNYHTINSEVIIKIIAKVFIRSIDRYLKLE